MSLLAGNALKHAVEASVFGFDSKLLNRDSLDIRLSKVFYTERPKVSEIDLRSKAGIQDAFDVCTASQIKLKPKEFIRAVTIESFHLPAHLSAQFTLRSAVAQQGLEQTTSIWLKPNWKGKLVLELFNFLTHHSLLLNDGLVIGQLHFFEVYDD